VFKSISHEATKLSLAFSSPPVPPPQVNLIYTVILLIKLNGIGGRALYCKLDLKRDIFSFSSMISKPFVVYVHIYTMSTFKYSNVNGRYTFS
jgi:hypothetical protein